MGDSTLKFLASAGSFVKYELRPRNEKNGMIGSLLHYYCDSLTYSSKTSALK